MFIIAIGSLAVGYRAYVECLVTSGAAEQEDIKKQEGIDGRRVK